MIYLIFYLLGAVIVSAYWLHIIDRTPYRITAGWVLLWPFSIIAKIVFWIMRKKRIKRKLKARNGKTSQFKFNK